MRSVAAQFGDARALLAGESDVHDAVKDALKKARRAAMQEHEPWPGARGEDLEDVAMALAEVFRSYGSVSLPGEVKALLRDASLALTDTDLLEPSYREMMRTTFTAMFPPEGAGGAAASPHGYDGGFGGGHGQDDGACRWGWG
jgi:hypothetical protein